MAKIAAIVLPSSRRAELEARAADMEAVLSLTPEQLVERKVFLGNDAVCCLLRVLPDPLNTTAQPIERNNIFGVMCGYYHPDGALSPPLRNPPVDGNVDPAGTLLGDVATGGIDRLTRGDGVYAFAFWDPRDELLVAGVDKLGLRPLYWISMAGGGYAVASEIKALVPFASEPLVNWAAWEEQFAFGFQLGDHTLFRGITRLGPARVLTCGAYRMEVAQLEQFVHNIELAPRPVSTFMEENQAEFNQSMATFQRLIPPGAQRIQTLSGGYDSRRIFGWLVEHVPDLTVYTVPHILPSGREYESGVVAALCRRFGVTGYRIAPPTVETLFFLRRVRDAALDFESDEHMYATTLSLAIRHPATVNFDGLGGDQIKGTWVKPEFLGPNGDEEFLRSRASRIPDWFRFPTEGPPLAVRLDAYLNEFGNNPNRYMLFSFLSRTRREIALAPLMIQANSFESFLPYVTRTMLKSALSFPPEAKLGQNLQRGIMEALAPHLFEVPSSHDSTVRDSRDAALHPEWKLRSRVAVLRREIRAFGGLGKLEGLGIGERLKQEVAFNFAPLLAHDRLRGQYRKGSKLLRLLSYLNATASLGSYTRSIDVLRDLFGSKKEWITRL